MWLVVVFPGLREIDRLIFDDISNSLLLCLFLAIWLAGEKVLHFDKVHEQESRNYFPSADSLFGQ